MNTFAVLTLIFLWNIPLVCRAQLRQLGHPNSKENGHSQQEDDHTTMSKQSQSSPSRHMLVYTNIQTLHKRYKSARAEMVQQIQQEYSPEIYDTVFSDKHCPQPSSNDTTTCTIGRTAFLHGSRNAEISWRKMVRKVKINILQFVTTENEQDFVWATAGNSAAAGHGNFFDQQYTLVMARKAKPLFDAIGLRLVARPYGRAGDTSAPEVAACAKELYGTDIDLIAWDFSLTDGKAHWRIEFFAHRVHILPNHPVLLVLQPGTDEARRDVVEHLTDEGMVVLRQDEHFLMERQFLMPDSKTLSTEQIDALPPLAQHYRCGYSIESGSPCLKHRFTQNSTCDNRPHQTPWHPGWKRHAFLGNLYALFLMELINDAFYELEITLAAKSDLLDPEVNTEDELNKMNTEENEDFDKFEKEAQLLYHHKFNLHDDVAPIELYRAKTYCHTAMRPAEARFKGHVFNVETKESMYRYTKGNTLKYWRTHPSDSLEVAYVPPPREGKGTCPALLQVDAKDFFLAHGRHGDWQNITIPNDVEMSYYGEHSPKGIIAICVAACSSECVGRKQLGLDAVTKKAADFMVNGELVESLIPFEDCFILVRQGGLVHWPDNGAHRYDLSVRVNVVGKWMEFNSFILW